MDNVDVYEAGLDGAMGHRARVLADGTVALCCDNHGLFHRVVRAVADYARRPGAAHWETDADGLVRRPCEHLVSTDPENSACVIAACGDRGAMAALVVLQNSPAGVAASLLVAVPAGAPTPVRPRVGRTRDIVRAFQRRHPDLALRGWVHACQIDLDGLRWGDLCRR
jgi:hypothetical protein